MKGNPVYRREMTVSSRSIRLPVMTMVFNSILALVALLNMYSVASQGRVTAEIQYSSFLNLYVFVALIEFLMLFFIMPALTAGSISGERERQTLNLMLSTQMTPAEIVLGKLISSMINMALLVISSFPVISLVFIYGGIQLRDLGLLLLLYLSVALLSSSLGLCFSAVCKRSTMATALSYGFLGVLLIGTYAINFFVWSIAQMGAARYVNQVGGIASQVNSGGFFYLLLLNPALTFYLVIGNQVGDREGFLTVMQYFGKRQLNPVLNAWIPFSICLQIFLSVIFLTIAVRAIDPMRGKKLKKQL
ncbi:MAG: ABC transporter permease subunit [Lachnospiraceae bacterium]|jgi:ABC-2 type transport system permease protein|nr:ABC transporter permease subunit [Lachnospiraceae bacterium]